MYVIFSNIMTEEYSEIEVLVGLNIKNLNYHVQLLSGAITAVENMH